jgi:hypothetical protein
LQGVDAPGQQSIHAEGGGQAMPQVLGQLFGGAVCGGQTKEDGLMSVLFFFALIAEHNIKQRYITTLCFQLVPPASLSPSFVPVHNRQHCAVPCRKHKASPILTREGGRKIITLDPNDIAPCRAEEAFVEFFAEGTGHALDVAKVDQVAFFKGEGEGREGEFGGELRKNVRDRD